MTLKCQSPECEHEFPDSVSFDEVEASEDGETPYFTAVYVPDDGFGVATDYICSRECMIAYLDEQGEA